jgi:hypothetical protein
MKLTAVATVLVLVAPAALVTDYKKDARFHVEHEARFTVELTEFDMEVDGEGQESGETPTHKLESQWRFVQSDEVRAAEDGRPTHVRRHYGTAEGRHVTQSGTDENTDEQESPFEGLDLDLTLDGDAVRVEITDGEKPDHDGALDGHRLDLSLDALLPRAKVEKGDSWELDNQSIRRALGLDLHPALFPKKPEAAPQEEGGERRGRRGRFGMSRRGERELLAQAEWTGTATVTSLGEDVDGTECAKVRLEFKSSGSLPEPEPGEGRRPRMPMAGSEASALLENTYSIELEGTLHFAVEARRPLGLELDGKVELETNREMTRAERTVRVHTRSEGDIEVRVHVRQGKAESK